jgi:hypothetical protein
MSRAALVEKAPMAKDYFGRTPGEDMPTYCPVCGRVLRYLWWDTVDGKSRYHLLACYGDTSKWRLWWYFKWGEAPWFGHAHYRYEWGPTDNSLPVMYDRHTGARLMGDES